MIESPVTISLDDQGRLCVCEMRGYRHDMNGAGGNDPTRRVSLLGDTDGDGRMSKATEHFSPPARDPRLRSQRRPPGNKFLSAPSRPGPGKDIEETVPGGTFS
ncbi:MAG: hypothetical protein ACKV19_01670 [Verrucomicrobiales bacterium]